jgi:Tol biopolymer transport system component
MKHSNIDQELQREATYIYPDKSYPYPTKTQKAFDKRWVYNDIQKSVVILIF